MARYELRLYMGNGCGSALLGEVVGFEAVDAAAAIAQADRRISPLPRHCFGALFDEAGAEIWTGNAPGA